MFPFHVLPIPRPVDNPRVATLDPHEMPELTNSTTAPPRAGRATWAPWSPLQLIVAGLGGFLIVLGTLALASTGVPSWTEPTTTVWGFRHSPLMAVIEIVLGLCLLGATPSAFAARGALFGFGSLMAVFGAIVLLEPGVFSGLLGVNRQVGVLYAAGGTGAMLLGGLVPIMR